MTNEQRRKNREEWAAYASLPPPEPAVNWVGYCFMGFIAVMILLALLGGGGSGKSLQQTALEKLDKGKELNYFEKKSIDDIFKK